MKKWHVKAALQGGMSIFPFRQRLNHIFQKYVTRSLTDTRSQFEAKLDAARQHLGFFQKHSGKLPDEILELGTGWRPVVPVALWLCGVSGTITSIDVQDLLRPEHLIKTLGEFADTPPQTLRQHLPLLQDDRLSMLLERIPGMEGAAAQRFLADIGIRFVIGDARQTTFEAGQFNFILSNNTFEHIPRDVLGDILIEFRRVLADDGLMSHFIDMSDHYSHFDRTITPYNFLRYPESQWRWFNNALQYQNRLRVSDYRTLHEAAGFTIIEEKLDTSHAGKLDGIPLAPEFTGYSREDLAAVGAWLVTRPE